MPDKPQPPRAPTVRRPTAKPTAAPPRPPVARAPLPARPVVITTTQPKSNASGVFFTIFFLLTIAGGVVWFVKYSPQKSAEIAAVEPSTPVVDAPAVAKAPTTAPIISTDAPKAPIESAPAPMSVATAPLPNVPVPPPLVPTEPDLYKEPLVLDAVTARGPAQQER